MQLSSSRSPVRARRLVHIAALVALAGCGAPGGEPPGEDVGTAEQGICPAGETVKGIDVSYYQGNIDWTKVQGSGMAFAVARVSYGSGFVDPKFVKNWNGIKKAGLVRGTYQFFVASEDPVEQAQLLLDQLEAVGGLEPGDLPPLLDMETTEGVSDANIIKRMHTWLDHVEQGIGRKAMIYTSPGFWNTLGNPSGFSDYPLWVAHWGVDCPTVPSGSWSDFVFWQEGPFSVGGIANKVDGDYFNGSLEDLLAFAKVTAPIAQVTGNGAISVAHRTDGTADVFVKGTGGELLHASAASGAESWSDLEPLASGATCGLAASSWPPTQKATEVWAPNEDGAITQVWWSKTSKSWSDPADFGGADLRDLATLAWRDGHVDVFGRDAEGAIQTKGFVLGKTWSEWSSLGGDFATGASAILWGDGHGELFATDGEGVAWHAGSGKDGWSEWAALEGDAASRPIPVRWADGHLEIFARGTDGRLLHSAFADGWPPLTPVGDATVLIGEPSAIMNLEDGMAPPGVDVFARDEEGNVLRLSSTADGYGAFAPHHDQVGASDPFASVRADGSADVFVIDADGRLLRSARALDGTWQPWAPVSASPVDPCAPPLDAGTGGAGSAGATSSGAGNGPPQADAPSGARDDSSGCACGTTATGPGGAPWLFALAVLLVWQRRRLAQS